MKHRQIRSTVYSETKAVSPVGCALLPEGYYWDFRVCTSAQATVVAVLVKGELPSTNGDYVGEALGSVITGASDYVAGTISGYVAGMFCDDTPDLQKFSTKLEACLFVEQQVLKEMLNG